MKKRILAMTCAAAVAAAAVPVYGAEETAAEPVQPAEETVATNLGVMVNEEPVVFSGQQPVIVDNVTLVPVRGVLETLGVTVAWDAQTHTIILTEGEKTGTLTMDSDVFQTGDTSVQMSAPAQNINGSAMIPLRAVAEYFGAEVGWDAENRMVLVTKAPEVQYLAEDTYEKVLKDENGNLLAEVKVIYPVLTAEVPEAARDAVNKNIAGLTMKAADTYLAEVKDQATQEAAELGENFHPFQLVISYEDAFYGKGVLSYLTTVWEYRGGANGTTKGVGKIYDLQTGETKTLGNYINLQSGLTERDYMVQVFRRDMASNSEKYLEGAAQSLLDTNTNLGYYLKDEKTMVVFADETTLKPHSEGIVKLEIPVNK